mmetsp:Transcript_8/g.44  ORF Transcript_8/g.44 Transcript_8/m.44 type:complete len:84 (-) Transcript_8:11-262(-)
MTVTRAQMQRAEIMLAPCTRVVVRPATKARSWFGSAKLSSTLPRSLRKGLRTRSMMLSEVQDVQDTMLCVDVTEWVRCTGHAL